MTQIDLTKILKDCPKGTRLYSPLFGEATFKRLSSDVDFPVVVQVGDDKFPASFTKDGRYYDNYNDAECMLFPSRENRDWSTFKVEPNPEQQLQKFKPFQKVLVRNHDGQAWKISLYSYLRRGWANPNVCIEDCYNQCIPYEGNEELLGTSDNPKQTQI